MMSYLYTADPVNTETLFESLPTSREAAPFLRFHHKALYEEHGPTTCEGMRSRDIADWPIAATSLLLDCPIWAEDQEFLAAASPLG